MKRRCPVGALSRALSRALTTTTATAATAAGDGGAGAGADALDFPHQERHEVQLRAGARVPAGACQGGGLRGGRPRDDRGHQRPVAGVLRVRPLRRLVPEGQGFGREVRRRPVGVCPFRWDPQELCFIAHPHNFYIFPRQELSFDDPAPPSACLSRLLGKIPVRFQHVHLGREQENELLRHLEESSCSWNKHKEFRDVPLISIVDVLFSERIKTRIKEWHVELLHERNCELQFNESSSDSKQQLQTIF